MLNIPTKLVDIVSIQKDAVVSREILQAQKGTVTVFAFSSGQGLSEHTNPFEALLYVFEGDAEVIIDRQKRQLMPGALITLPANTPHSVLATTDMKMLLIMIRT